MRKFLFALILGILIAGGAAAYLYFNTDSFSEGSLLKKTGEALHPDDPGVVAHPPQDYHLLSDLGGIPYEQAVPAGLVTDSHAYLSEMDPIGISENVNRQRGMGLRGNNYDFCYTFDIPSAHEQQLEFNLKGEWDELHFGFGFDDTHPTDPSGRSYIEFTLSADGESLFGPEEFRPEDKPHFAKYDVSGASRLSFIVRRKGQANNSFAPTLFDAFVLKVTGKE